MTTDAERRRAAELLLGQSLADVTYVGLGNGRPDDCRWDFGDWHWPEVGVQFKTSIGDVFHAIWNFQVTAYELTLAEGPISDRCERLAERQGIDLSTRT